MSQIKGSAILGALAYIGEQAPQRRAEILDRLPQDCRPIYGQPIVAGEWYPYSAYSALLTALDRELGAGDLSLMPEVGRWAMLRDTSSVLKILAVFSSIEALITRGFAAWGPFFWNRLCDTGTPIMVGKTECSVAIAMLDFPDIAEAHCHLIAGYLEGMAHAVGASTLKVSKTHCVHRGDQRCQYFGRWR